ncbi:MAG: (2Fe-2S)-binding protein [Spirochaetaceae bacterium]|jgi:carbon-monoxide dehydrogenase small subunit|nr:(2Fe-2S)-binding protein [Spirochaetaceae bacterium]
MNKITVNGRVHEVNDIQLEKKLLSYLRDDLELTGTKNGCNVGACGSCTVLIDQVAKKSCVTPMSKAIGKSVLTIEGVQLADGSLHPLQQAFIDCGAVQCGFCTPGMIMKGLDLLNKNPDPDRDEIRKAFNGNLCRCTGYQQIVDGVQLYVERQK